MSPKEVQAMRARLEQLRDELVEEGNLAVRSTAREGGDGKVDDDAAPLSEMQQVIASNRNRERAERLALIAAALARLEAEPEDFGDCEACGEPIARRRLELMPWARTCIACQSNAEADMPRGRRHLTDYG